MVEAAPAADLPGDPWASLRDATRARIGLRRTGDAQVLNDVLAFQHAHARARDAVHAALDGAALARAVAPHPSLQVRSLALDRPTYLRRPDLGRRPDLASLAALSQLAATTSPPDVAFVAGDGLSAVAVQRHAARLFRACLPRLHGWQVAPLVIATQARVALADEVGAALGASLVVVVIGERPGLSVADSLGVYLTWAPRAGRRDAERNCVSNIHEPDGLGIEAAADRIAWLMNAARRLQLTGVGLKDASPPLSGDGQRVRLSP